jgi:hypothetical protein
VSSGGPTGLGLLRDIARPVLQRPNHREYVNSNVTGPEDRPLSLTRLGQFRLLHI